jgi:hypothetical protein
MGDLLRAAGFSGFTLLAVAAIAWLAVRSIETFVERSAARQESQLRQSEARWANALASRSELDLDLRQKREAVYRSLWKQTHLLSLTPVNTRLTYADVSRLSTALKDWYFEECGGLYLSSPAQNAYRNAQEALAEAETKDQTELVWHESDAETYERMRAALSALRTELTNDLQSRISPSAISESNQRSADGELSRRP